MDMIQQHGIFFLFQITLDMMYDASVIIIVFKGYAFHFMAGVAKEESV